MSYDLSLINWQTTDPPPRRADGEFDCPALGTADEVRRTIKRCLRRVDWSNPAWGTLEYRGHLLEFILGERELVESLMVHTHDESAFQPLARLCEKHGWSAFDHQENRLVDFESLKHPATPDAEAVVQQVITSMFGSDTPTSNAPPELIKEADEFFKNFVRAMQEHSLTVADYYDDCAELVIRTNRSVRRQTGGDFKKTLPALLERAQKVRTLLFNSAYSHLFVDQKHDGLHLKCVRYSRNLQQYSPYDLHIRRDATGQWRIIKEIARASL